MDTNVPMCICVRLTVTGGEPPGPPVVQDTTKADTQASQAMLILKAVIIPTVSPPMAAEIARVPRIRHDFEEPSLHF
jgi:hypothetical protein